MLTKYAMNETTIKVRTAIDNCGSKCERFEVEADGILMISGEERDYFPSYRCKNLEHCARLLMILENYGEGADD